jgi:hypothetical protein
MYSISAATVITRSCLIRSRGSGWHPLLPAQNIFNRTPSFFAL